MSTPHRYHPSPAEWQEIATSVEREIAANHEMIADAAPGPIRSALTMREAHLAVIRAGAVTNSTPPPPPVPRGSKAPVAPPATKPAPPAKVVTVVNEHGDLLAKGGGA